VGVANCRLVRVGAVGKLFDRLLVFPQTVRRLLNQGHFPDSEGKQTPLGSSGGAARPRYRAPEPDQLGGTDRRTGDYPSDGGAGLVG
jgi:hypothetical protein